MLSLSVGCYSASYPGIWVCSFLLFLFMWNSFSWTYRMRESSEKLFQHHSVPSSVGFIYGKHGGLHSELSRPGSLSSSSDLIFPHHYHLHSVQFWVYSRQFRLRVGPPLEGRPAGAILIPLQALSRSSPSALPAGAFPSLLAPIREGHALQLPAELQF